MVTRCEKENNYSWMGKMLCNIGSAVFLMYKNNYGDSRYLQFSILIGFIWLLVGYKVVIRGYSFGVFIYPDCDVVVVVVLL